jgi:aspartate/methionine/tyrosine aminotransferase
VRPQPPLSRSATAIRTSLFADLHARIEERRRQGTDLIGLHLGDSNRSPPEGARFSRHEGVVFDGALYRYGSVRGIDGIKEAFTAHLKARSHGPVALDPERHVLVACGATHAMLCAVRAIVDPGDEVLVAAPYWPLAVGVLRAAGATPIEVPLTTRLYRDPHLRVDGVFDQAVTPRTRAIYVATPNNPDGKVLTPRQLDAIGRVALERNLWVIADEVYADYVYEGPHTSMARDVQMSDRTISIYSLSKSYALAGARVGFAVAPEHVIELARRLATHSVFNVPVAAQRVALAALRTGPDWIDAARLDYRNARDETVRALADMGIAAAAPDGGSFVFADFAPVLAGRPLKGLLELAIDRGVLVAPGEGFGEGFASWARVCFTATPRGRLVEGLARLGEAVRDFAT